MFNEAITTLVDVVELGGVAILVIGATVMSGRFVLQMLRGHTAGAYQEYRLCLGRVILLGLEFLIIADIISTVTLAPTFRNLGVLGLLVLIRTFLSFVLEIELNGRLPWITRREPTQGVAE